MFIKRFTILPVVESCNANNFFFFVDNWQGQHILDGPSTVIQSFRLQKPKVLLLKVKGTSTIKHVLESKKNTWNLNISSAAAFMMLQILNTKQKSMNEYVNT